MRITFIGIGAQKCASSWVYDILADHPEVLVPSTKELDYFSYRYENGRRWYERQFTDRAGVRQCGEISPSYLHEPAVVERARDYERSLRILVSLRDPVERAMSQHRHLVRLGIVAADDLRFETALDANPTYVEQGRYHHHLTRWIGAFGRDQVHVMMMDDIARDGAEVARTLYTFLGVDSVHRSAALDRPSNPSYVVRSKVLEGTVKRLRDGLESLGAERVWRSLGDTGLREAYRRSNRQPSATVIPKPPFETEQRLRLLFRDDTQRLAELLQRDLSSWLPE